MGPMGGPDSASSMAGCRTSDRVSLPPPQRVTTSSHTAAAPGTTTQSASVEGTISVPTWPRERRRSNVKACGLDPPPCTAVTFLVSASNKRANASPPMPVLVGSHTLSAAATATAASPAVPP